MLLLAAWGGGGAAGKPVCDWDDRAAREAAVDEELAAVFSEPRYVAEMLAVEAALATVEARLGVIPAESGKVIAERTAPVGK